MDKLKSLIPYVFIFFATFFLLQYIQGDQIEDPIMDTGDIGISTVKSEYAIGKDIQIEIQNNTDAEIILASHCPNTPFDVYLYSSEGFQLVENTVERNCEDEEDGVIAAGETEKVSLLDYSYTFFGETGIYKAELTLDEQTYTTPEFTIKEPSFITSAWRNFIYRPILNALVAILIYLPGHYLWAAVMLLTLFLRTLLLIPSQKAMRAQRNMQEVQPKLEEIKKKYEGDQARIAQETMLIWKQHKVNPMSSCLPTLVQFPILIALFYVVKGGLTPDKASMIYDFLPAFSLVDINPVFFMFDLLDRSIFVFPIVIGALQFTQMQLMMAKKKSGKKALSKKSDKSAGMAGEMENATKMMKYVMPVMIAFFTAQMPAAVGLYWGTTTFYGIIQQLVVNNSKSPQNDSSKGEDVSVRVINKNEHKK
jgi:YidC/Oxa1 family membrane protein insertase